MITEWHILGAGAVGTLLACKLQRAGIPATLVCRNHAMAEQRAAGLSLLTGQQSMHVELPTTCLQQKPVIQALIVTTKANAALGAFLQASPLLATGAPVLLLHNGMGVYEQIEPCYPAELIYCGNTTEAAYFDDQKQLVHAGAGETRIGQIKGNGPPDWFAPLAGSAEAFLWEEDIEQSLWRKLVINCAINPLSAVHNCRNGELLENAEYRDQVADMCRELAAVTAAQGYAQLASELPQLVAGVISSSADNQSSMLQDIVNNRPTEIDAINGYLCVIARQHGIDCPLNVKIWAQVKNLEQDANN